MKRITTLILLLFSNLMSYAQKDTLFSNSPLDFYPLNLGDVRHYKITDYHIHIGTEYRYFSENVLKDTVINTRIYKKIKIQYSNSNVIYRYERIDSHYYIVYRGYISNGRLIERPRFYLNAQEDQYYDNYKCSFQYRSIFGQLAEVKSFSFRSEWDYSWHEYRDKHIAKDFGYILESYDSGDMSSKTELVYTKINGVEYGSPIAELIQLGDSELNEYMLYQNYPNPFNSGTKISFYIHSSAYVQLAIYNTLGQRVHVLIDEVKSEGEYTIEFDGSNLSTGIYFYKLRSENVIQVKKMVYIK